MTVHTLDDDEAPRTAADREARRRRLRRERDRNTVGNAFDVLRDKGIQFAVAERAGGSVWEISGADGQQLAVVAAAPPRAARRQPRRPVVVVEPGASALTAAEVAALLRRSLKTVDRLVARGRLPCSQLSAGGGRLFRPADVERLLAAPPAGAGPLAGIDEFIRRQTA